MTEAAGQSGAPGQDDPGAAGAGAAGAGAGGNGAGGNGAGAGGASDPWYRTQEIRGGIGKDLDDDDYRFLDGKNPSDFKSALKSWRDMDTMARSRQNGLPAPDPTRIAEWEGWEKALGWNKDFEAYTKGFSRPQLADGEDYDVDFEKSFLQSAHKHKVPGHLLSPILSDAIDYMRESVKQRDEKIAAESEAFNKRYREQMGAGFDGAVAVAKRALNTLLPDLEHAGQLEKVLGSDRFVDLFFRVGQMMGEDELKGGGESGGNGRMTIQGALAEKNRLMSDKDWVERSRARDPAVSKKAQEELARLNRIIAGEING